MFFTGIKSQQQIDDLWAYVSQFDDDGTDASPLDKVLRVWNLGAPRVTALRDMGLDADEFCRSEDAGHTIRLIAS